MIVVRLMGGLGNQMFQYAAGRALAVRHSTVLKLDLSFLEQVPTGTTFREFLLPRLNVCADKASPWDVPPLGGPKSLRDLVVDKLLRATSRRCRTILTQFESRVNNAFFSAPDNSYLAGYWQSERYFADISSILQTEFSLSHQPSAESRELSYEIIGCESVSIHVRRGDYAADPAINAVHGVCPVSYYERCVSEIMKEVCSPRFFVFSDDPQWVLQNFNVPAVFTVIGDTGERDPAEDLWLMSLCKHSITANSSFSWWGAWLNRNPEKKVFAPFQWFRNKDMEPEGLIPAAWRRM